MSEVVEVEMTDGRPRDIYDKYTKREKELIVAIVSFSAFLARKFCGWHLCRTS